MNPWSSNISEHTSPNVMSENQTPIQDQRCQSGPTARNSFDPGEGRFSKNYEADQQRLQISDLHFDKFPHTSKIRLLEDKIQNRGMYLFTIYYGCHAVDQGSGDGGREDGVPKAGHQQAADSRGSRTCTRANKFIHFGVAHAVGKDELTSCRGTVQSAWQNPPVRRKGGRAGLPARVSGRHVVRRRQSSPILEVHPGNSQGW